MADSIVACPGCGKSYSVPDGVPPGQFQCQDCAAVVPYGASAPEKPASKGKAKGRGRKAARGRAAEEKDDRSGGRGARGAPAKKEGDPTPFILGIVAVAIVVLLLVLMNNRSKKPTPGEGTEAANTSGGRNMGLRADDFAGTAGEPEAPKEPEKVNPLIDPDAATSGTKPVEEDPMALGPGARPKENPGKKEDEDSKYEVVKQPPTGGNYGKDSDELRSMIRTDRASVINELPHLPDTDGALQQEIDKLVEKMADPYAGREALDAQHRLVEIGRAAIPRLLSAAGRQNFSGFENTIDARDPCIVADGVDGAMREITGKTNITKLQFNPQGNLRVYERVIENWYVWWLNSGYERASFPKKKETLDEE